jgi:hypothetical protein
MLEAMVDPGSLTVAIRMELSDRERCNCIRGYRRTGGVGNAEDWQVSADVLT